MVVYPNFGDMDRETIAWRLVASGPIVLNIGLMV